MHISSLGAFLIFCLGKQSRNKEVSDSESQKKKLAFDCISKFVWMQKRLCDSHVLVAYFSTVLYAACGRSCKILQACSLQVICK